MRINGLEAQLAIMVKVLSDNGFRVPAVTINAGAELVRFVKGNLPGASLWYSKGAFDHLIFHQLQEYFSPGYLAKMRSRSLREFGQRYWWEPGTPTPQRAPDLEAAVGE